MHLACNASTTAAIAPAAEELLRELELHVLDVFAHFAARLKKQAPAPPRRSVESADFRARMRAGDQLQRELLAAVEAWERGRT